jgi:hypothetical protein
LPQATSLTDLTEVVTLAVIAAFAGATRDDRPFRHWRLADVLPVAVINALRALPFPAPDLRGLSGKRELHNNQRSYFDVTANLSFDACAAVADAFQSTRVCLAIQGATGADLSNTYVRLEYAQDVDGFWLEPHTDLGVKRFTMLLYLPESTSQIDLGTDLYSAPGTWAKRSPFTDNTALVFVPGPDTWHGLAPRPIAGVRRSIIMNYVTADWLAREQLAYPDRPVLVDEEGL